MKTSNKIILLTFPFLALQAHAQSVWDNINLASFDAKILNQQERTKENDQLISQTFETNEGKIYVYLPPLSSGVTLSGTVYLEPNGTKDSSKNLARLQSNKLYVGDLPVQMERGPFKFQLPASNENTIITRLQNSQGETIRSQHIPVSPAMTNNFMIPPYMVSGDAASIRGIFDGNSNNTAVTINGQKPELLAESPSQLFLKTPGNISGHSTVISTEKGVTQTGKTNIIKLNLSADKTNLRRGQQTQIHIMISGLEGLNANVPVTIQNTSPSVIALEGGNTQQIVIDPKKDAASGTFTINKNIQSLKDGSFSLIVSIAPYPASSHQ